MTELETQWVAGWLEGEGYFQLHNNSPRIRGYSVDKDTIIKISLIVGGSVSGPRELKDRQPIWEWAIYGKPSLQIMEQVYPYMSIRRRTQIDKLRSTYDPYKQSKAQKHRYELSRLPVIYNIINEEEWYNMLEETSYESMPPM